MKRFIYAIILFFTSLVISPISNDTLPDFYVEMLDTSGTVTCSGFIVDPNTIMSSVHCLNISNVRMKDGQIKDVVRLYIDEQDDVAIFHLFGDGYLLDEYPTLGYSFILGILRIHSHVNEIHEPLFFLFIDQSLIQDIENVPELHAIVDVLIPVSLNVKAGHSGSAVVQNGKIVGMVLGHSEIDVEQAYIIPGMTLLKHLDRYRIILKEVEELISTNN